MRRFGHIGPELNARAAATAREIVSRARRRPVGLALPRLRCTDTAVVAAARLTTIGGRLHAVQAGRRVTGCAAFPLLRLKVRRSRAE